MDFKFPSFWKIVLLLILIPVIWLAIWFLLSIVGHGIGIAVPSVGDATGFLGSIGSIMGAIFTVGGLIVALVAILTQIQLQDRVKQEVDKARQEVEDTFNNKLIVEYEKRIQEQVEGMLAYFQATNTSDLREAEALTHEALRKYPKLPGIRSALALKFSRWIEAGFSNLLYQVQNPSVPEDPYSNLMQSQAANVPPTIKAIEWLKEAIASQDDPEGQVSAALALMYGYSEAYDMMIEILTKVLADYPSLVSYMQSPAQLLMLIYGCQRNYKRIKEVMHLVGLALPTEQEVKEIVTSRQPSLTLQHADWFAVEKHPNTKASKVPLKVCIFLVSSIDKPTYAAIYKYEQYYTIPNANASGTLNSMEADKLIELLFAEFTFICK